eukprot:3125402-Prymnesium_polylepis.1
MLMRSHTCNLRSSLSPDQPAEDEIEVRRRQLKLAGELMSLPSRSSRLPVPASTTRERGIGNRPSAVRIRITMRAPAWHREGRQSYAPGRALLHVVGRHRCLHALLDRYAHGACP